MNTALHALTDWWPLLLVAAVLLITLAATAIANFLGAVLLTVAAIAIYTALASAVGRMLRRTAAAYPPAESEVA